MSTGHLVAEITSRYDLRCVFCDLPARHPRMAEPCPTAKGAALRREDEEQEGRVQP